MAIKMFLFIFTFTLGCLSFGEATVAHGDKQQVLNSETLVDEVNRSDIYAEKVSPGEQLTNFSCRSHD